MFYLFIHALIITKISVLVRVGIRWILGGVREELVGDWGSYSGDITCSILGIMLSVSTKIEQGIV